MIEDGKRRLTADCLVAVHGSHGCECKVQRPQGREGERGALFTSTLSLSLSAARLHSVRLAASV